MPDIIGMPFLDSVSAISVENLELGICNVEYNSDINHGNVVSQNPSAGTGVFPGTEINITVSLGQADPNSVWAHIGLTTGSFPFYIPPVNTPVSIIDTQHQDPFEVDSVFISSAEYLPSLISGDNHANWSGTFVDVPLIRWIDPLVNSNINMQRTIGLTGVVTGDTSAGVIEGDLISSNISYTIESGPYSGHMFSKISWELEGYTGIIYAVGDSSSGDFLGVSSPGEFWGRVDGDIKGMYRTTSLHQATIYITSIEGAQASGTLNIVWSGSSYDENISSYNNIPLYIQEDISWSAEGSGCVTGNLVHSGTSVFLPGFNIGQYLGEWFYYETDPNNYDQSGYIFTYLYKITPMTTIVPFVEGLSQQGAEEIIANQGLSIGSVTMQSSDYPTGHVVSQNPASGMTSAQGTAVNLVVSE